MNLNPFWAATLAIALAIYLAGLAWIGIWSWRRRKDSAEDFLLAGRNNSVGMATLSLVATWFGAGVMLTVADNVASEGIYKAVMDPLGVSLCLLLAARWLARPLWEMGIITLCDFYRRRYGVVAEKVSALILVPSYFGWIAVQFVVLAEVLQLLLGIPREVGIVGVMLAGTFYTLVGGMRAVVLTDAIQMAIILAGLVAVTAGTCWQAGWGPTVQSLEVAMVGLPPVDRSLLAIDLLLVGALGNLPAQDLIQRMLCVGSAKAASRACYWSAALYFLFGLVPVLLGLMAANLFPEIKSDVVMNFAHQTLHGPLMILFVLAVVSAVLSTISGAILSPAGVVAQNLVGEATRKRWGAVQVNQVAILLIALLSLATAFSGRKTFDLLEEAYSLMLAGLLVPLLGGLWFPNRPTSAALASMLSGTAVWVLHLLMGWDEWFLQPLLPPNGILIPANLAITVLAAMVFLLAGKSRVPEFAALQ